MLRNLAVAVLLAGAFGAVPGAEAQTVCTNGFALDYPCSNVDLLSMLTPQQMGGAPGAEVNDIWGWTDPVTHRDIAIVGRTDGSAFVDVTDPLTPKYLGNLPATTFASIWRDMKVYADHAFIVADGASQHGMQVFDLTQLRSVDEPKTFDPTVLYTGVASVHNIAINEETGFAYAVGSNSGGETCGGGLHMVDISNPASPEFAGCFADDRTGRWGTGYTHDVQCVIYHGPDADYHGREICVGSNETAISVSDVTDKDAPQAISVATYPDARYIHQGWFTDDQRYFFQDDELDEFQLPTTTKTYVWDLTDLDDPQLINTHDHGTANTDHNLYIRGNRLYQAHYVAGLRIHDISDPESLVEVGYFDTIPELTGPGYDGAWSVYPFFESGIVLVSSSNGLFVLQPTGVAVGEPAKEEPDVATAAQILVGPNPVGAEASVTLTLQEPVDLRVSIYDLLGREVRVLADQHFSADSPHTIQFNAEALTAGTYFVAARGPRASVSTRFVVAR